MSANESDVDILQTIDKFIVDVEKVDSIERYRAKIERMYNVRVCVEHLTVENGTKQCVMVEGENGDRKDAKDYILAICSPDDRQNIEFPPYVDLFSDGILEEIEKMTNTFIVPSDENPSDFTIYGSNLSVTLAVSMMEEMFNSHMDDVQEDGQCLHEKDVEDDINEDQLIADGEEKEERDTVIQKPRSGHISIFHDNSKLPPPPEAKMVDKMEIDQPAVGSISEKLTNTIISKLPLSPLVRKQHEYLRDLGVSVGYKQAEIDDALMFVDDKTRPSHFLDMLNKIKKKTDTEIETSPKLPLSPLVRKQHEYLRNLGISVGYKQAEIDDVLMFVDEKTRPSHFRDMLNKIKEKTDTEIETSPKLPLSPLVRKQHEHFSNLGVSVGYKQAEIDNALMFVDEKTKPSDFLDMLNKIKEKTDTEIDTSPSVSAEKVDKNEEKSLALGFSQNMLPPPSPVNSPFKRVLPVIYKERLHKKFLQEDTTCTRKELIRRNAECQQLLQMNFQKIQQQQKQQEKSQKKGKPKKRNDSSFGEKRTSPCSGVPVGFDRIKNILFKKDDVLGIGCHGTVVYRGKFDERDVAVKRLLKEHFSLANREVELLREADQHPNVIRYFCTEEDSNFLFIALELCEGTLQDYVEEKFLNMINIEPIELLHHVLSGLAHLHSLVIVHRDLKPHNIMISKPSAQGEVRAMISDFGFSKKLHPGEFSFSSKSGVLGTMGWTAPEMLERGQKKAETKTKKRLTVAVDIFSAGCLMYYVLTKGLHPFGDNDIRILSNIQDGEYNLDKLPMTSDGYTAKDIIHQTLSDEPEKRPTAKAVLHHPLFWNKEKKLMFIQDASDWIEVNTVNGLEQDGVKIVGVDWTKDLCPELQKNIQKDYKKRRRHYNGSTVQDLLRVIRNKKHHYNELPEVVKKSLGSLPEQFLDYFTSRFPLVLIHTYRVMECCAKEDTFKAYYKTE